ncbi:MAG TPA: hypothetical protein VIX20_16795, partial [Ktedonobacteraceae bacterium]
TTRTDIYGLGATLYVLLTGIVPLDAMSRVTRSKNKGPNPLKPVHLLAPQVPPAVSQAIQRAMNIKSDDRYETIEQFWQELKDDVTHQQAHIPRVTSADMPQALPEHEDERNMRGTIRWLCLPILLALLVTIALATGFVSYVWGFAILLLLCIGILLILFLPWLHRR